MPLVWEAWTQPDHICNWNFASDDWCCPGATNNLLPGGTFNYRMEATDGSAGFDFEGTYVEVEPHKLIRYTIGDGRLVDIRFEDGPGGITVTESFETEDVNSAELQRQGWQAILDNFKKVCGNIAMK